MKTNKSIMFAVVALILTLLCGGPAVADTSAPAAMVRLVFIHHSTGGNWLADPNEDQPYGGLAAALMSNNYYVSATNYGWGPNAVGDRTDIPNWPEWFTGTGSSAVLSALYSESGQNIDGYGDWARPATAPAGENTIVMFKSCFPNSDLFGNPDDAEGESLDEQFTVANAKAVYNNLLTYFATRPDKFFVVITAPPQRESDYAPDYQTPAQRAANARAFNNWLVNSWRTGYPHHNVMVFDYYNVLTGANNHHRISGGTVEHVTPDRNNFAHYPSEDSHPNATGHQKATAEFVPLLNYHYNIWKAGSDGDTDGDTDGNTMIDGGKTVASGLWLKAVLKTAVGSFTLIWKEVGADTTPSGDRVVSGYFYADPSQFAYGSVFNPEVFVKIYIASNGWANIAFNHVTVDDLDVYSAHNYAGTYDQYGTATLNNRLVEHSYTNVPLN